MLAKSGILFSIFFISVLYTSFLNDIIFCTSLIILKETGKGTNLWTSILSTLLLKLLKLVGTSFSLSKSNLFTSDFKLTKSVFLENFDVSAPVAFFKSVFVANLIQLSLLLLKIFFLINSFALCLCYQSNY